PRARPGSAASALGRRAVSSAHRARPGECGEMSCLRGAEPTAPRLDAYGAILGRVQPAAAPFAAPHPPPPTPAPPRPSLEVPMATFVDRVVLHVIGGSGGHGAASIRREKFNPLAGPDGGNGGRGGDVILEVDASTTTLLSYHHK